MKKLGILLITAILFLSSCSTQQNDSKIRIITTIFPMTDLVSRLVTDEVSITQLVPNSGDDGHHWEPSPKDIVALEEADVFVYNGANMETWVDTVLESLNNKELIVINASKDIEILAGHNHDDHDEEEEHDDHEHQDHDHDHSEGDPHTWSTPKNAAVQLATIKDSLVESFPEYTETIEKNYEDNKKLFDDLDQQYRTELATKSNRTFVVQHEAFGYLAHQYDLFQVGIEGLVPTSEPDASKMAEIIKLVKDEGIKTIFYEENVSSKVAEAIANETGAKTAVLSTLSTQSGDLDLVEMMKKNLETLIEGL